jgi:hypothetical protein
MFLVYLTLLYLFYICVLFMINSSSPEEIDKISNFIENKNCDLQPDLQTISVLDYDNEYCISGKNKISCYWISVKKESKLGVDFLNIHYDECFSHYPKNYGIFLPIGYLIYFIIYFIYFFNLKINIRIDHFIQILCVPFLIGILTQIIFN